MSDLASIFGKLWEIVQTHYPVILAVFAVYFLLWLLGKFGLAAMQDKLSRVLRERFAGQRIPSEAKMKTMLLAVPLPWKEIMKATLKVFDQFRTSGIHQVLVIDEYGGIQGMVTLYDVLEAIVGEIAQDEEDKEQEAVLRTDGSWRFDGMIEIDELKEILELNEFPGETRVDFQTLSGFVMDQLG
jgi:CBS domain containing-hemolysin-like protein